MILSYGRKLQVTQRVPMHLPMKKVLFILLGSAALTVSVAGLRAQAQLTEFDEKFKAFDQNSDGIISGSEMNSANYLPRLDLNKDGKLTHDEALEAVQKMRKLSGNLPAGVGDEPTPVLFKRMDKNSDGAVDKEEYVEFSKQEIEQRFTRDALGDRTGRENVHDRLCFRFLQNPRDHTRLIDGRRGIRHADHAREAACGGRCLSPCDRGKSCKLPCHNYG